MLIWMITRGWLLFIPLVIIVALAAGLKDVRWAIVAVTYLLVCVPMILTPVILSHILTPKARRQLALKSVRIDSQKNLTLTYFEKSPEDESLIETDSETIPFADIKAIFHLFSTTIVWLKTPKIQLILIPD